MKGHYVFSTDISRESLTVEEVESVTWSQSSPRVRRGFCGKCGSTLFFDPVKGTVRTSVAMGAFDQPTEVKTVIHIFVSQKGEYYEITDGFLQNNRSKL